MSEDVCEWELYWVSTPEERYDEARNKRWQDALAEHEIETIGGWGGTDFTTGEADNAMQIKGTRTQARLASKLIRDVVGGPVSISLVSDDE